MKELKTLGNEFNASRHACKRLALHKCGHEDQSVSASECLLAQVGDANANHFIIASQDRSLRNKIMRIPGGSSIFATVNGIHLEQPSEMQKPDGAKAQAKSRIALDREKRMLLQNGLIEDDSTKQQIRKETYHTRKNRAKGPNPLAMKKKRAMTKRAEPMARQPLEECGIPAGKEAETQDVKRKRKRRRRGTTAITEV
jgi:U3 small nucleolar RNA-associated protein 23